MMLLVLLLLQLLLLLRGGSSRTASPVLVLSPPGAPPLRLGAAREGKEVGSDTGRYPCSRWLLANPRRTGGQ